MNAIIYSRVSTLDQDNQRQIQELQEYAKYKKFQLLEVFQETISGASKASERTEFRKLLEFIESQKVNNCLVWELSRLGRSMMDVLNTIELFSSKGINIYIKKEGMNTLDEQGKKSTMTTMLISILSGFAEMERETIRQRSISGIRQNVSQGGSGTGIVKPYGYEKIGKKLAVHPEEADVVKLIFKKYLSGLGTKQIANFLNNQKIQTRYNKIFEGKEVKQKAGVLKNGKDFTWKDGTIYAMLTNSIYTGQRKHKGEIFKIAPIIDEEIFTKAQIRLTENYNKQDQNRKYENILKDIIVCGNCGQSYYMHKRADGSDNAYKCLSKRYGNYCGNPSISIDKLLTALYTESWSIIVNDILKEKLGKKNSLVENLENKEIEISNTQKEIESINRKINNLINMKLDGSVSDSQFRGKNAELKSEEIKKDEYLKKLKKEYDKLQAKNNPKPLTIDYTPELFKEYAAEYIDTVRIFEVTNREVKKHFTNAQDIPVLIQVKPTFSNKLQHFVISQRTMNYMKIGLLDKNEDEKESVKQIKQGKYKLLAIGSNPFIQFKEIIKLI